MGTYVFRLYSHLWFVYLLASLVTLGAPLAHAELQLQRISGFDRIYLGSEGVWALGSDGFLRLLTLDDKRLLMDGAPAPADIQAQVLGFYCNTPNRVLETQPRMHFLVTALASSNPAFRSQCLQRFAQALSSAAPATRDFVRRDLGAAAPPSIRAEVAQALGVTGGREAGRFLPQSRQEAEEEARESRERFCEDASEAVGNEAKLAAFAKTLVEKTTPAPLQHKCVQSVASKLKAKQEEKSVDPKTIARLVAVFRRNIPEESVRRRATELLLDQGLIKKRAAVELTDKNKDNYVVMDNIAIALNENNALYEVDGKTLRPIDIDDDTDLKPATKAQLLGRFCAAGKEGLGDDSQLEFVLRHLPDHLEAAGGSCVKELIAHAAQLRKDGAAEAGDAFVKRIEAYLGASPKLKELKKAWDLGVDHSVRVSLTNENTGAKESFKSHPDFPSIVEGKDGVYFVDGGTARTIYLSNDNWTIGLKGPNGFLMPLNDDVGRELARYYASKDILTFGRAKLERIVPFLAGLASRGADIDGSVTKALAVALAAMRKTEMEIEGKEPIKQPIFTDVVEDGQLVRRRVPQGIEKGITADLLERIRAILPESSRTAFEKHFSDAAAGRERIADPCSTVCGIWKNYDRWAGGAIDHWAQFAATDWNFAVASLQAFAAISSRKYCPTEVGAVLPKIIDAWKRTGARRLGAVNSTAPNEEENNPYKLYGWHFSIMALKRAQEDPELASLVPRVDTKYLERRAAQTIADHQNVLWKGGSGVNWFAMVLSMQSLSPDVIAETQTTWTSSFGPRSGNILACIADKLAIHQAQHGNNPLSTPYDITIKKTSFDESSDRRSAARIAPTYALLWQYDPGQYENFIKGMESFVNHLGSLMAHATRDRTHEGPDRLAPYYLMPSFPVTSAGIEAALPFANQEQKARLLAVRDRLERAMNELFDHQGNFISPSGQFGNAVMWTNPLGVLALLPSIEQCGGVSMPRGLGILPPGFRGPGDRSFVPAERQGGNH